MPRGFKLNNFRPAFVGDHRGTRGGGGSQPTPPLQTLPLPPPPPSNTSLTYPLCFVSHSDQLMTTELELAYSVAQTRNPTDIKTPDLQFCRRGIQFRFKLPPMEVWMLLQGAWRGMVRDRAWQCRAARPAEDLPKPTSRTRMYRGGVCRTLISRGKFPVSN